MHWLKGNNANLLFPYNEYMSDFKQFQRIPIFDAPGGMSVEDKINALRMANEIVQQVEQRRITHPEW